ncbi:hypothetical protein [Vibrio alginolyticus]|uniref:hypothetical protein n=1 Tax=Vibrio alginolyticus TaxID=663 RepID=UPI001EFCCE83|nr:hypothetical protein [Vibrio alginolyticus]
MYTRKMLSLEILLDANITAVSATSLKSEACRPMGTILPTRRPPIMGNLFECTDAAITVTPSGVVVN